jgi:outer membrane protein assembly factor BamD
MAIETTKNLRSFRGYMQPMIRNRPMHRAVLALLAAAALGGCALLRTPPPLTPDRAYQQGMEAYEAGRHRRAAELLQQFVTAAGPDARLKPALMALARSRMQMREYVTAAADYLRVATQFPADPEAEEARFGLCNAYHLLSPRPQLDQEYTHAAVAYCESYAQYYPGSPRAQEATGYVAQLRTRLAEKAYLNGFYYFRRGLYDASVVYFDRVLDEFPETVHAPAALARLVEAYARLGYREEEAAARQRLQREYPQSPEARTLAPGAAAG